MSRENKLHAAAHPRIGKGQGPVKAEASELAGPENPVARWAWAGCILLVIASCLHSADKSIGGGDTWVAMACGRFTVGPWATKHEHRTWQMRLLDHFGLHVTKRDFMGAKTRPYHPDNPEDFGWVNQNWLTHALFYKLKTAWGEDSLKGENLIVVYKFLQAILTGLFAYWAGRMLGAHPVLAGVMASFGMLLSRSFIDLRPNISSILFAAIMILAWAYWKNKRPWAMVWMVPVMIIWSNVHGGFIYAIMIFAILVAAYLVQKFLSYVWRESFIAVSWRQYSILLAGALAVLLIPGIFSPFGWENLIHPFVVATGKEGEIWRNVVEWRPIWPMEGFGNVLPYFIFLGILAATFVTWWVLFFLKPRLPAPRGRRHRRTIAALPWPRIDLAQLGVMAITVAMSVQSRRFVFLGGVVLAPFVAQMLQEIVNMIGMIRQRRHELPLHLEQMPRRLAAPVAWLSLAASAVMFIIFFWCMWDVYYRPPLDGRDLSVFRRMVGIGDQPVTAIRFVDANQLKGVVFNEWTNGGFVAFGQKPRNDTGEPTCKLYMDGRAQAAYRVGHFQKWNKINYLIRDEIEPETLAKIFEREGVNAALLDTRKSRNTLALLLKSRKWVLVYTDGTYVVLLERDASLNEEFFEKALKGQVKYPDEFSRKLSLGHNLCHSKDPDQCLQGFKILTSLKVDRYAPTIYETAYFAAHKLKMYQELWLYLSQQRESFHRKLDSGERFGRLENTGSLIYVCSLLQKLAKKLKQRQKANELAGEIKHYQVLQNKLAEQLQGGWLW